MKESDKELLEGAGLASADAVVATIDALMGTGALAAGAWGLAKSYFGRGLALRQSKALEWVEMVRDNPSIFTKVLLESYVFQDAFVTSLEGYIKERSEEKREVLRAIFLDYSKFPDAEDYPLEKMQNIVQLITLNEMRLFSRIAPNIMVGNSVSIRGLDARGAITAMWGLRQIGLFRDSTQTMTIGGDLPEMVVSELGGAFARYMKS